MPQVVSASRRTDIPAFYAEWFVNRLKAGMAYVRNPYSGKYRRVSLLPEDVDAVVFWSKNYAPLLPRLGEVEKTSKSLFFHFTITGCKELEPKVPGFREAIKDYVFLANRYSSGSVIWRFDPITLTEALPFEVHEERFVLCAELLKGHARECIISFTHPYKKILKNFEAPGGRFLETTHEQKKGYAKRLSVLAKKYGIALSACCNDYLLSGEVGKAGCIDGRALSALFNKPLDRSPAGTRPECACTKSADIGAYDTCAHGCLYCYANSNTERAEGALRRHDPKWNSLATDVSETEPAG